MSSFTNLTKKEKEDFNKWLKDNVDLSAEATDEDMEKLYQDFLLSTKNNNPESIKPEDKTDNPSEDNNKRSDLTIKEYVSKSKYPRDKKHKIKFNEDMFIKFIELKAREDGGKFYRPRPEGDWNKLYDEFTTGGKK